MPNQHLQRHGLSYWTHLANNVLLTKLAIKSAFYTLSHGLLVNGHGQRASELHNEIWTRGRCLSLDDLNYRLANGLYPDKQTALADLKNYAALYNERPLIAPFRNEIDAHFDAKNCAVNALATQSLTIHEVRQE